MHRNLREITKRESGGHHPPFPVQRRFFPTRSGKGFTLIELLIVVAVIAILAAIAIPQYTYYARNAKISACAESTVRCLRIASSVYGNTGNAATENCGEISVSVSATGQPSVEASPSGCTCSIDNFGLVTCNVN